MPDETPHLRLPYMLAGQAQKHVTHNEALRLLDALVQMSVLDRNLTAPPGSPTDGARYIVASGGSGAWNGWDLNIAFYVDGAWMKLAPQEGWLAWVADEDKLLVWTGSAWAEISAGGAGVFSTIAIGGATADATNRLAVSAPATLFNHAGAGHQTKVNKAAASDTASHLFQTAFSGRAEFGLLGNDSFTLKVSPDGASWVTALTVTSAGVDVRGSDTAYPFAGVTPAIQMHGVNSGATTMVGARWSADAEGGILAAGKSRGAAVGTRGALQSADRLGRTMFYGDNGATFTVGGSLGCRSTGDWSAGGTRSAKLEFHAIAANTLTLMMEAGDGGTVKFPAIGTTASAGNAYLDSGSGNSLLRSTSSERYKREIEPVERSRARAVLDLEPIWYRSDAAADRQDWSWYGLSAEAVAAVEPRLVHWGYQEHQFDAVVEVGEDGSETLRRVLRAGEEMVPDGVMYDRLAVLLLEVVKEQESRIAALETALAEISARLAGGAQG